MKRKLQHRSVGKPPPADGRSPVEQLIEDVLRSSVDEPSFRKEIPDPLQEVLRYDTSRTRVVVLGGGTGLSTVVGGNSADPGWADMPFVGLKEDFPLYDLVVVTTDDGGSTGKLLRELSLIGLGDLRKSCLSMISRSNLKNTYRLTDQQTREVVGLIQLIFNYRFPKNQYGFAKLRNPLLVLSPRVRKNCPPLLSDILSSLGSYTSPGGGGPTIRPAGHCLGNLLLTAAIIRATGDWSDRPPGLGAIRKGLDTITMAIGAGSGRLHAATSTPGQLSFRYSSGVEVLGQKKAALARRWFAIERVTACFSRSPVVSSAVIRALAEADLIIYAPGSLFSSMIPLLQIRPLLEAIRKNHRALKVLAANFWVQEGETDISPEHERRGFLVSELLDAYKKNLPGGVEGLVDLVLSANLDYIPGHILRNYALEGKTPILLDRHRVEEMGFQSVEAILFPLERLKPTSVIHHDPENFSLAIRTILYAWNRQPGMIRKARLPRKKTTPGRVDRIDHKIPRRLILRDYLTTIRDALREKTFQPEELREILVELAWENRDISPEHFRYFNSVRTLTERDWNQDCRKTDPLERYNHGDASLEFHQQLLGQPDRLRASLLIAMGTSLLGRAFEEARWIDSPFGPDRATRGYLLRLRPIRERRCFLTDKQLRCYLELAQMVPDRREEDVYRAVPVDREGYIPPDIFFGLLYAWYLNNNYIPAMDYEMTILRWPTSLLMPFQRQDQKRKQDLVSFFRTEIFGYPD
ncbi:MAG: 2-phospho-L-lactate transferase CofD family protein [Candidatus Auribacterota bacterium]|nr:2-phospho-L-lactate transferase CofD family protein [Candidatus Auribacterota bacterium]